MNFLQPGCTDCGSLHEDDVWSEVGNNHGAECKEDYLVSSHSHWLTNLTSLPPR